MQPAGICSDSIRYLAPDGNRHQMHHLLISGTGCGIEKNKVWFYLFDEQKTKTGNCIFS